jgi:O-antigen ligase
MTVQSRLTVRQEREEPREKRLRGALVGVALLVAVLLATVQPAITLGVMGASALCVMVLVAPVVGLYLLPLAVAFGSLATMDLSGMRVGATDLLVGVLCVAWVVRHGRRVWAALHKLRSPALLGRLASAVQRRWEQDRLRVCVVGTLLAYLAVILASSLVARDRAAALKEGVKWTETALVVLFALWLLRRPGQIRLVVWLAIAASVAEALIGLGQWIAASGPFTAALRASGTFDQPNPYAGYLNLALAPALALAAFGKDARERWAAAGASFLLLLALALSGSRGGLLGLVAAMLVLVIVGQRWERLALVVVGAAIPLLTLAWLARLLPTSLLHMLRLDDLVPGGSITAANFSGWERLAHWAAGINMFRSNPALGVGAGNYADAYAHYASDLATWPEALGHAHNYYINAAAETGLLGLLTFCAFTVVTLLAGWRRAHTALADNVVPPPRALALGLFAALLALAVHNVTDDLFVHAMELQAALYIGCMLMLLPGILAGSAVEKTGAWNVPAASP